MNTSDKAPAPQASSGLDPALVKKHQQDSLRDDGRNPGRLIPDVPLAKHINHTPFWSQYFQTVNMHGAVFHTVVTRISYDMGNHPGGVLAYAADQSELAMGDVFADPQNPQGSEPLWESDFCPFKPRCDVLVVNAASRPPMSEWQRTITRHQNPDLVPAAKRWNCAVALKWKEEESGNNATKPATGRSWSKQIGVTGPRKFGLLSANEPEACSQVRIGWAQAYGGPGDERNPLGTGRSQGGQDRAPQQEMHNQAFRGGITQINYPPVSLGPVGKAWLPRRKMAGTYDNTWLKDQWPLPPKDFDYGYWNCAPADQQVPYPPPGTEISLANLYAPVPEGKPIPVGNTQTELWHGKLPMHQLFILPIYRAKDLGLVTSASPHRAYLDTLVLDLQAQKVHASYRCWIPQYDFDPHQIIRLETRMAPVGRMTDSVPAQEMGPLG